MTSRVFSVLAAAALLAGCSSRNREPQTGPGPDASVILTPGDSGSQPEVKNPNANRNASTAARFGIPPGHLPPPGQCKVWMPGEPPGQQKKKYTAGDCNVIERRVPPGGWLVYHLNGDKKQIVVREFGTDRSEVVAVRIFDAVTGALLWEETPGDR